MRTCSLETLLNRNRMHNQQGFALVLTLFVVAAVMIMGMSIMTISMMSSESAGNIAMAQQDFQVADGGAELGRDALINATEIPESGTLGSVPPYSNYTDWDNDLNADGQEFPEYRYNVKPLTSVEASRGFALSAQGSAGKGQQSHIFDWHIYEIHSQSRGSRARYFNQIDREIVLRVKRLFQR